MSQRWFIRRFRWFSALPLMAVTVLLFVLAILVITYSDARRGGPREALFDFYQRLTPAPGNGVDAFHVIAIDEESLSRVGPWPWPRSLLAEIVANAGGAGARGVILAEPVDAPDPLSPETIGAFWLSGARDEPLAEQLSLLPGTDALLARALTGVDGVVALEPRRLPGEISGPPLARTGLAGASLLRSAGADTQRISAFAAQPRYRVNDAVQAAAKGIGVSTLPVDDDGVLRAVPLIWSVDQTAMPQLALTAAIFAGKADAADILSNPRAVDANGALIDGLAIGDQTVPTDRLARLRLYWPKNLSVPSTAAWRLLDGAGGSNRQLADKVVLIGRTGAISDPVRTARGGLAPVNAQALIAQQIHEGAFSARAPWAGYLEAFLVLMLGAAAIMVAQRLDFWKAVLAAFVVSAILFGLSAGAFSASRLLIDPVPGALALFMGALSVAGGRSLGAVLTDDKVRGNFQGALPENAMQRLREDGVRDILDGTRRDVTVLACELRFTDGDLERLEQTPGEVTRLIAAASAGLRKTITEAGGAADQADGGKIYAYFNAPLETADHVRAAASAALRLIESMDDINGELEASPHARNVQIHLAIGIATGPCHLGPMGYGRANRYSAVGPAIERAAFLRRLAETYGPAIICDETIYRRTHHHFAYLELDRLKPQTALVSDPGAARSFSVYALVGNPFIKSSKGYRLLEESHRKLLASYRAGDFAAARTHLADARRSPGAQIALFDLYQSRLDAVGDKPDSKDWDGSVSITI